MDIFFKTKKLQKACNNERDSIRQWGPANARKIRQRLAELRAAVTLENMKILPAAGCHPLKGNRAGQFAVDVNHPFRLIFEPDHDPVPRKDDGGVDLGGITRIRILAVEDYHGE